jgi:hypothetical protein
MYQILRFHLVYLLYLLECFKRAFNILTVSDGLFQVRISTPCRWLGSGIALHKQVKKCESWLYCQALFRSRAWVKRSASVGQALLRSGAWAERSAIFDQALLRSNA